MAFPNFGKSSMFGQPQTSSTFGGFGSTPATSSFTFGTTPKTTASPFGFGSTFSAPASTSTFSFGSSFATTSAPTFGSSSFATTTPSFSFGTASTQPSTGTFGFGLGGGPSTSAPAFGQPQTSFSFGSTAPSFGTAAGSTGFGTGSSLFGTGLGASTGLGSTSAFTGSFAAPPANASSSLPPNQNLSTITAVFSLPILFDDERDAILAKWNQLQALWGVGKGFYYVNAPPVEFNSDNPFFRFKCIGYSRIPTYKPEDGLVGLYFNKKDKEVFDQKQQIIDFLHRLFGSKPNLNICIEGFKTLVNDKVEVIIYVVEKINPGLEHRIPAPEVLNFLQQANIKPQLSQIGVEEVVPKTSPTKEQLQIYLDSPPAGIDEILWKQAKADNPNPEQFIPVPLVGFDGLLQRLECQQRETLQHQERLHIIGENIAELKRQQTTTNAKIAEIRRKFMELSQRLLRVMVKQEISRKMGFALQPEEEQLQNQLEAVQSQLDAPTQYRGRLKELLSQIRLHNHRVALKGENEHYKLSSDQYHDIRQHLQYQSEGINYLISILKEDMRTLEIVEGVIKENSERVRR